MGESDRELLKAVRHCQESLDKYTGNRDELKLLHYLNRLYKLPIKVTHLEQTGVGRTVNALRKLGGCVGESAKSLVTKWKAMVVGEHEKNQSDDEDGYQTGEEEATECDNKKLKESSSHNKTDKKKNKEKEKKSHKRSHHDSSSSEEDSCKKPKNRNYDKNSDSEEDFEDKNKKEAKAKKHRTEKNKTNNNAKDKTKHKKQSSKEESRDRDKSKSKLKQSTQQSTQQSTPIVGINSGSGASFAEALGMCESSSSKSTPIKKKTSEKKEKVSGKGENLIPKLLKEPTAEPLADINISSLLPSITPNYRPLGNILSADFGLKKGLSESEALSNIISSKNQRTKVYSGNKIGYGKIPSLFELCIRVLQDNIDALEYTGGVPFSVLKQVLEKANANQLYTMEHHNPYLVDDTDYLWKHHCSKEFRNKKREELESWREMYLRCFDERAAKLKTLTANIKQSQDKSLPVRMTKLAYVDAVAKPPRNIARKQLKNGTAFDTKKSPAAKLVSLAIAGEAGKVAVPNPGSRVMERSTSHVVKPKKAPLMLKSISSFKNRFKR